eukprot:545583_1
MASQQEQLQEMRQQLEEIKTYVSAAAKTSQDLEELKKKVKFLEERFDGNPLDLAREFTLPEIKNICIKGVWSGFGTALATMVFRALFHLIWKKTLKLPTCQGQCNQTY